MQEENANSVVDTDENANANSQEINKGTQENDNSINATVDNVGQVVDYATKFSESSKEALRLYNENKALKEALELKDKEYANIQNTDNFYPGFDELDEDARNNLVAYTNTVTKRAKEEILKDPAIAFAKTQYNEQVWESAFQKTIQEYPELAEKKSEFKSKYFNVNNVPQNIDTILKDVAKIYLFDKAKEIGAKEELEKQSRVDLERSTAGQKDPQVRRSLEDWTRMASENPAKFAKLTKEYNEDLKSGKI